MLEKRYNAAWYYAFGRIEERKLHQPIATFATEIADSFVRYLKTLNDYTVLTESVHELFERWEND